MGDMGIERLGDWGVERLGDWEIQRLRDWEIWCGGRRGGGWAYGWRI